MSLNDIFTIMATAPIGNEIIKKTESSRDPQSVTASQKKEARATKTSEHTSHRVNMSKSGEELPQEVINQADAAIARELERRKVGC